MMAFIDAQREDLGIDPMSLQCIESRASAALTMKPDHQFVKVARSLAHPNAREGRCRVISGQRSWLAEATYPRIYHGMK
jgi:hypothetical protein